MFTGIIEEIGVVKKIVKGSKSLILTIQANLIFSDLKIGDSVAVNGVCLTATSITNYSFTADAMHATLSYSTLNSLHIGDAVNLERAMPANGRFGGHVVTGHIDGVGKITDITKDDNAIWYSIEADKKILAYSVEKGSITVDGISLTIALIDHRGFKVSIIPQTARATILSKKAKGDVVNLENDIMGKYIGKLLGHAQTAASQSIITKEFLTKFNY